MISMKDIDEVIEYFWEDGERRARIRLKGAKGAIVVRASSIVQ